VYKVPSLNYGHCLVNTNRFGIDIAYFVVVSGTRLNVFWCGACFGAGVGLPGETMCAMKFDALAVVGNVNL
jgi:hypothetical protein